MSLPSQTLDPALSANFWFVEGNFMNYGKTQVVLCENENDLGVRAASAVAERMRELLSSRKEIKVIFAAGESQSAFLEALAREGGIDWSRVICFNMDDFWDTRMPEEYTCGYQTRKQLYDKVCPQRFYLVRFNAADPQVEAKRFEALLRSAGEIDILCQGIGTSGHLALNEPDHTDFNDFSWVRVVDIAEQSKRQLGKDPNFSELGYIPQKGITMTIPALLTARSIYTMVPLGLKREILTKLFKTAAPTVLLPASVLSTIEGTLFVDRDSCPTEALGAK
jgi:glucosamine-6-phosphate deaminase